MNFTFYCTSMTFRLAISTFYVKNSNFRPRVFFIIWREQAATNKSLHSDPISGLLTCLFVKKIDGMLMYTYCASILAQKTENRRKQLAWLHLLIPKKKSIFI